MTDSKKTIALFDFDGTLTYRDSLLSFLFFCKGSPKTLYLLFTCLPTLIAYCFNLSSRQKTKEKVLTKFFKGDSEKKLNEKGKEFAKLIVPKLLRPEANPRIKWHLEKGHSCYLISANLQTYLDPWSKELGFKKCISTRLEVTKEGTITGKLKGLNCWGPEKEVRLKEELGDLTSCITYVYGDSRGDKEILSLATYPFYKKLS